MAGDKPTVPVDTERLARLKRAVSAASEGAFAKAAALLDHSADDQFGEFERLIQSFIIELKISIEQSESALSDAIASREVIQQKLITIEQQQAMIRALSNPIIDVWEGVITVPLSGFVDASHIQDLTKALLDRIEQRGTRWILLDLTGIDVVDSSIATQLMKLAASIRLMGAECLLTGIRSQLAQTFVALGIQLDVLRPMATLRSGIEYCIVQRRRS